MYCTGEEERAHYLFFDLLEAVEHWHTGDTVYLAEGDKAHRVETVFAGYLGKVDDGTGEIVNYQHGLVILQWGGGGGGGGGGEQLHQRK